MSTGARKFTFDTEFSGGEARRGRAGKGRGEEVGFAFIHTRRLA